jgi:two-component system, chemotaxis family, chemotaxis protein CheY
MKEKGFPLKGKEKGVLSMRILIAEDEAISRELLNRLLSPYGQCDLVENGTQAVEAFMQAWHEGPKYDLVCLDIMMPEVDGQIALKGIRTMEESEGVLVGDGVKIIMVTALSDKENVFTAFKGLCDAYLVKPIDKAKLLKHLKEFGLI